MQAGLIACLLSKFSDNQTYVKVLTKLQILEPIEVYGLL